MNIPFISLYLFCGITISWAAASVKGDDLSLTDLIKCLFWPIFIIRVILLWRYIKENPDEFKEYKKISEDKKTSGQNRDS